MIGKKGLFDFFFSYPEIDEKGAETVIAEGLKKLILKSREKKLE